MPYPLRDSVGRHIVLAGKQDALRKGMMLALRA